MSDYFATHLHFKLKKDTPNKILDTVTSLFDGTKVEQFSLDYTANLNANSSLIPPEIREMLQRHLDVLTWCIHGVSEYHDGWRTSAVNNRFEFYSFASCPARDFDLNALLNYFKELAPYLDAADGDILAYYVFEKDNTDVVIYFDVGGRISASTYRRCYDTLWGRHPGDMADGEFDADHFGKIVRNIHELAISNCSTNRTVDF